jgi:hypothetical protein
MGTFAALDQRIATRYAIKPMNLAESAAYLRHHMTLAGREEPLFADDAVARLHRVSSGLPRALNNAPPPRSSPPRPPARTSSTMPAPRKQSPSSPATDRQPGLRRGTAGWWRAGYQAGHQAAGHEQAAARWHHLVASYRAQHAADQRTASQVRTTSTAHSC